MPVLFWSIRLKPCVLWNWSDAVSTSVPLVPNCEENTNLPYAVFTFDTRMPTALTIDVDPFHARPSSHAIGLSWSWVLVAAVVFARVRPTLAVDSVVPYPNVALTRKLG